MVKVLCRKHSRLFSPESDKRGLIIEVLSPTTEAFDRGDKFADYRQMESLQEYVLVSQTRLNVECFRRNSERQWVLYPYAKKDVIHLASVDFRCAVADLYEDVTFESP
ncbi:Uma2 family endonuclease [Nostoc sp.]|uniref:Uma2 family endonuclease n=1 Tax=Nostoc sp. TaxID=1180 RepID=UPI003FA543AA